MSRSITPAVPGSLSPEFITVPSSTGFSVGDYVYQKNGDYGVPLPGTTASFAITPSSVVYGATVGGTATPINSRVFGSAATGGSTGQCAAKLTNGNIVIVYRKPVTTVGVYFRIVDANNVSVVAETVVTTTILPSGGGGIGVIALTGGGFVVHYSNTSTNKVAYAVYTNTGTVTTALAIDTTFPTTIASGKSLAGCALPNGGFALAVGGNALVNAYFRAFDSLGVGAYAWTSLGLIAGIEYPVSIAARSDSSICVIFTNTSTIARYDIRNSTGGAITGGNIAINSGAPTVSVACLTNDTFVLGYLANGGINSTYSFRLVPTGNVLGGETSVPTTNMAVGGGISSTAPFLTIKELSSGGFVYLMTDTGAGLYYVFYNSAGTALYSIPKTLFDISCYKSTPLGSFIGIVETPTHLSLYHTGAWPVIAATSVYDLYNTKINLTDYSVVASLTTNTSVSTISTNVGSYGRATSLPTKAAYTAANTETLTLNSSISYVVSPRTIGPAFAAPPQVDSIKSTTLPDGRFAIVYKIANTGVINFNVYSIAGDLQTTVLVGTGGIGISFNVRIAALSSGKIAVAYQNAANNAVVLNVYSTTYALLGTTNVVNNTSGALFDIAGTNDDRVALAFSSGGAKLSVYSSTPTLIYGPVLIDSANTPDLVNIGVSENGTIWTNIAGSSQPSVAVWFYADSATTYAKGSVINHTSLGTTNSRSSMAVSPTNIVAVVGRDNTTTSSGAFAMLSINNSTAAVENKIVTSFSTQPLQSGNLAIGCTGAGSFVWFGSGNAVANIYGFTGINSIQSTTAQASFALLSGINPNSNNMQACITPSYGYNAVISWVADGNNIAQYAIVCAFPYTVTQSLTAGVTNSLLTTPLNISESSGYYLAGIAVTDCPPGGTGQVQTNGIANLNSQYSASTAYQGFDFQNPVTVGVKGTVFGRTVTMIKD